MANSQTEWNDERWALMILYMEKLTDHLCMEARCVAVLPCGTECIDDTGHPRGVGAAPRDVFDNTAGMCSSHSNAVALIGTTISLNSWLVATVFHHQFPGQPIQHLCCTLISSFNCSVTATDLILALFTSQLMTTCSISKNAVSILCISTATAACLSTSYQ